MLNEFRVVSDPISTHIWVSLHNYAFKEALFTAERLFAEAKSEESLYLLATCYYRMGRPKQVIRLLNSNNFSSPKTRYLLSKCYFDCDMLSEAENSLIGSESSKSMVDSLLDFGEQACYAFLLLGDVYKLQNNYIKAKLCYKECLKLNPFMWTAFENLCSISEFIDPDEVFKLNTSLGLFTPTFTVVGHAISTSKSPVNVNVKAERDKLGSRENVNPNSPIKEVSDSPMEGDTEKPAAPLSTSQVVKSTYVTQCTFANQDFPTTHSLLPEDLSTNFTPVSFPITTTTPGAPLPNREELKIKVMAANDTSQQSNETPSFGLLSTIPQSPMYACVPIFSRIDLNSLGGASLSGPDIVQPIRLALHQTTANRRQSSRQAPANSTQLQATILFTASTVPAQWRSKETNVSTPIMATPSQSLCGGMFGHNFNRASGITPVAPWLQNSLIPGSLGGTSTPAAAVATPNQNTFPSVKPLIFDEVSETTKITTSRGANTPMEISEAAESLERDSSLPDNKSCLIEPRTRAQKARAAASVSQRRSPRLSRAPKSSASPTSSDEIPEYSKVICTASGDRNDPRTEAISAYLHLLRSFGRSFSLLIQHDYKNAVTVLSELPFEHMATGRTLAWAARAHVDAVDYSKAHRIFTELRRLEPWQLYGMDLFSTVLWYEGADQELSQLASDLLTLDRSAPEPWTATGNYYSLQREHDTAIRFFRRALQVCPTDAYACTLLGHEYISTDSLDRAASAFRHALRLDERSYSARFGLSNVYFKQDYFGLADAHLVRAISLFPNSSLLLTHLGAIRARIGRLDEGPGSAIDCLNKAVSLNPTSAIALYHRACVLSTIGRYQDAIEELERLMLLTPHEAMIYFMLGHAYQKVGNATQAMIHYSWAMELDPKGVNSNLRDIMATASGGRQQQPGPFACPLIPSASGTPGIPSSVQTPPMDVPRPHHRRGGGPGGGNVRPRRSARGRQPANPIAAASHRLFLSPSTTTPTPVGGEAAELAIAEGINPPSLIGGADEGDESGTPNLPWGRRRGRSPSESAEEEVDAEEVGEEETMDLGDE